MEKETPVHWGENRNSEINSAAGKAPEIHHLLQSLRPDVLIGTETWLDHDIASSELFPPEYKVYRKDRNRNGGGVLIAVLKTLVTTEEPLLCPNLPCEILWIRINIKNRRDLLIGSYYRPDDGDEPSQLRMAESIKLACDSRNAIVVLGGDFNFPSWDWENSILKRDCGYPRLHRAFKESLEELQLEQIVKTPTRGENVLDLLVTSHPGLFPHIEIVPGISDHDIVYAELQVTR
ncbi:uncharacterized protein LOC143296553 [Babylonia areolata]|uniref:uncharacterized protein LOC143296553 n=1 Tax=Babylonia areolata TaxID=304850 RepID=UPI003FD4B457